MRLLMPIAVFFLLSSLANPIYSQTIINTDTTWSGEITLTEDVEIGAGATLTIEAGAIVDGSGDTSSRYRRLTIVGTLRVNGNPGNLVTLKNIYLGFFGYTGGERLINIDYANLISDNMQSLPEGRGFTEPICCRVDGRGTLIIKNSTIKSNLRLYYNEGQNELASNIIDNYQTIIYFNHLSSNWLIKNNLFKSAGIDVEANYISPDRINVIYNSFSDSTKTALENSATQGNYGMLASNNYFGTTDVDKISARILDGNDSITRGVAIDFLPILTNHHPDTPANSKPEVSILDGARVISDTDGVSGEAVIFVGTATDADGTIDAIEWLVAGTVVATGLNPTISLPNGSTIVTLKATDNSGDSSEAAVTITVSAPTYTASADWPAPYNGVTPDSSLGLILNNIGSYDSADSKIYTCLKVYTEGLPSSSGDDTEFDIILSVVAADEGTVQISKFREFNAIGALNEKVQLPDCSGKFETTTGVFTDTVQTKLYSNFLGNLVPVIKTFETTFNLIDSANLILKLDTYKELSSN